MRNVPILLASLACLALAAPVAAHAAGNLAVGDLNGDGQLDLHAGGPTPQPGHPPPKSGLAVSSYQTGASSGQGKAAVAVADVNGDGHPDLHAGGPAGGSSSSVLQWCATGQHIPKGATACTADGNHAAPVGPGGTHVVH